eukprot:4905217-Amphidinium_carterae.1
MLLLDAHLHVPEAHAIGAGLSTQESAVVGKLQPADCRMLLAEVRCDSLYAHPLRGFGECFNAFNCVLSCGEVAEEIDATSPSLPAEETAVDTALQDAALAKE